MPDRAGRYWLITDSGEKKAFYRQTIEDFGLYTGKELSDQEWEAVLKSASEMSAKMRAVRIASASSVSKRDLEKRLIQKGEDPQQARQAVQWMEDMDLLDDRKTAEQVVNRCIQKGYGLSRAKQALYEKQIPKALWETVLEDYPEQNDKISEFLHSRLSTDSNPKDVKRAIDALMRKGHSYYSIKRALDRLELDTEQYPEE